MEEIKEIKEKIKNLDINELEKLNKYIQDLMIEKSKNNKVSLTLEFNRFKGSGKCWIAICDPKTKKIENFIEPENTIIDGYKGIKIYNLPLVDGVCYLTCQTGSKSHDERKYYIVENKELKEIKGGL